MCVGFAMQSHGATHSSRLQRIQNECVAGRKPEMIPPAGLHRVAYSQSVQEGPGECFFPANLRKFQIVSLLDMVKFDFPGFVTTMRELNDIIAECSKRSGQINHSDKTALEQRLRAVEVHA